MNLSKTTTYALQILFHLSLEEGRVCSAIRLYRTLGISLRFVHKLLLQLTEAGLLQAVHGNKGGYQLIKKPEDIFITDIIDIVDGNQIYNSCLLGNRTCEPQNCCLFHSRWVEVREKMVHVLSNTSLADIHQEYLERIPSLKASPQNPDS